MYCPNCGNKLSDDERFCGNCGAKIPVKSVSSANKNMRKSDDSMIPEETEKDQERMDDSPKSYKPINKILVAVLVIIAAVAIIIAAGFAIHSRNYQKEEAEGFTGDPQEINPIFYNADYFPNGFDASGIELYYTIIDLAGDGVPELFIADQNGAIYDSFCIMEGEGQILPLIYLWEAPGDVVYICEDNMLKRVSDNSFGYYRVDAHAEYAECTNAIMQNGSNYYYGYYDDASGEFIKSSSATASDYQEMANRYTVRSDITWLKISDYD